jgi:hypothetical protein
MMQRDGRVWALALAVLAAALPVRADLLWNEPLQGDLSDDRFHPNQFFVTMGSNELIGFMSGGDGASVIDRDYFTLTVPQGMALAQINLLEYFSVDVVSFMGLQPGTFFPNDPETVQAGDLLGWTHFGPPEVGSDLLAIMASHGNTFTPPLPSGKYTFWCQQIDDPTDYLVDFVVVPAPGTGILAGVMLAANLRRRSR